MRVTESADKHLPVGTPFILKEWSILGLEKVNTRKEGDKVRLSIVPADTHNELLNEYTVEGLSLFNLPVYYSSAIQ